MTSYQAPAKVNLHLAITDIRDDGYHVLDTSFVYLDIWDTLHIEPAEELQVSCSEAELSGESNLVYQLLSAFKKKYGIKSGLRVHIEKKLPSQAGLGGGSSDAATALMVANKLWDVHASTDEMIKFAAPFGADIPCFLFLQASLASGIGESLKPYNKTIPVGYVLVAWPGIGVSTALAFRHYDENKFHALTREKTAATVRARSGDTVFETGYNDLEESAVFLCHPLEALLSKMRQYSDRAWMSGSGSACVAICHSSEQADKLAALLQGQKLATWMHIGHFMQMHPLKIVGA